MTKHKSKYNKKRKTKQSKVKLSNKDITKIEVELSEGERVIGIKEFYDFIKAERDIKKLEKRPFILNIEE